MQQQPPKGFIDWKQNVEKMYFYQKSKVIYDMTFHFTKCYMNKFKDRTVDQMVQAARCGKQNFVEGFIDGLMSTDIKLRLITIGRGSLHELKEDYEDYLRTRNLTIWTEGHPRYAQMVEYCKYRNNLEDYEPYYERWNDEEIANICLTLFHMTDRLVLGYLRKLEQDFLQNGGIKETMYKIRTEYRDWKKHQNFYYNYKNSLKNNQQ